MKKQKKSVFTNQNFQKVIKKDINLDAVFIDATVDTITGKGNIQFMIDLNAFYIFKTAKGVQ